MRILKSHRAEVYKFPAALREKSLCPKHPPFGTIHRRLCSVHTGHRLAPLPCPLASSLSRSGEGLSQPQRVLVQPRVAHVLGRPLVQVVVQHRRCGVTRSAGEGRRAVKENGETKRNSATHMFSGKQRAPADRRSRRSCWNRAT